jgi:hypothetical protein
VGRKPPAKPRPPTKTQLQEARAARVELERQKSALLDLKLRLRSAGARVIEAFVESEVPWVLGIKGAGFRLSERLLRGVQREARSWYVHPWTEKAVAIYREKQGFTIEDRKKLEAAIEVLVRDRRRRVELARGWDRDDILSESRSLATGLRRYRLIGEVLMPLRLGDTSPVTPWAVNARLIMDEILIVRRELERRVDLRVSQWLSDPELSRVASFLHELFSRLRNADRHAEPPARKTIKVALTSYQNAKILALLPPST